MRSASSSLKRSCIEPFTMPCSARKLSSAWAMTSTMAEPMPTTSKVGAVMGRSWGDGGAPHASATGWC